VDLANQLADSDAHGLRILLGVQLNSTWIVLCPTQSRGFRVLIDGVVRNSDLHALMAAALIPKGIAGVANPADVIAFLEGYDQRVGDFW
jgi:hypothetical protein